MILVDTSVWIDFLREGDDALSSFLQQNIVFMHPMVLGELSCGNLSNRQRLLNYWQMLPVANEAKHSEVMAFIECHSLNGKGIGFIDFHLLVSCHLTHNTSLWTRDKHLANIAIGLGVALQ